MSSFRRRIPATAEPQLPPAPPGTRIVAHTGQFVVSSGVASLDEVVGGGFPLGSLALLKLDRGTSYGNLLLRYFAAQALVDRHGLIVVTCDSDPETFVKTLPRPIDGSAVGGAEDEEDNNVGPAGLDVDDDGGLEEKPDDLKIAWRYKPVGTFSTAVKADGTGRKNGRSFKTTWQQ